MAPKRTPFPPVFWVANIIEVLERFAYYGIYFSFGIYLTHLGFSRDQLGVVQTIFLLLSAGFIAAFAWSSNASRTESPAEA